MLASPLTPPPAPQMTWCTILRLLANAQDAQATSEIRKWTFAEVSFFRGAQLYIRDVVRDPFEELTAVGRLSW